MHRLTVLLVCALVAAAGVMAAPAPFSRPSRAVPKEVRLADLLALPRQNYRVDPYLRVAEPLQAMGRVRAVKLLHELAAKDEKQWPHTRTIVLCRMLFKARPQCIFRRAAIGGPVFVGRTSCQDWPSEPIEVVQGVPFLVSRGYELGGRPEPLAEYVRHCQEQGRRTKT